MIKKYLIEKIKKEYDKNGYFVLKNFFNKKKINKVNSDIINLVKSDKDIDIYYDRKNRIRRVERLYDKTKDLNNINKKLIEFINKSLGKKLEIFKDKFNAKPPGGEGFSAHFDGIFYFKNRFNKKKRGWYEYNDYFLNVLVALDRCEKNNGTIEISPSINGNFNKLYKLTKKNYTPDIDSQYEKKLFFKKINLEPGDCVFFRNTCPHRSKKNKSKTNRRTLYYTYTKIKKQDLYEKYFKDKKNSKNKTSKSLSGDL